jgi:hypothetical protein
MAYLYNTRKELDSTRLDRGSSDEGRRTAAPPPPPRRPSVLRELSLIHHEKSQYVKNSSPRVSSHVGLLLNCRVTHVSTLGLDGSPLLAMGGSLKNARQ